MLGERRGRLHATRLMAISAFVFVYKTLEDPLLVYSNCTSCNYSRIDSDLHIPNVDVVSWLRLDIAPP